MFQQTRWCLGSKIISSRSQLRACRAITSLETRSLPARSFYQLRAKTVGDRHRVVVGFKPHRAWELASTSFLARIRTVPPAAATTSPALKPISACRVGQNVLRRQRLEIALTALWRYNLNDSPRPTILCEQVV